MTPSAPRRPQFVGMTLAAGLAVLPIFAPSLAQAQAGGTPANPPGTAAGRALDRATGSTPDGTPGNPPGTALGRATDRAIGTTPTPANPTGITADRAPTALQPAPATALQPPAASTAPAAMTPGAAALARPRLSQLIGGNVYNDRNERIGEVEEILLSPPSTLVATSGAGPTAIIQVGGFLGIGGRLVMLPLGDLRWNTEREHILLPGATKESLGTRPAFEYVMLRTR